MSTIKFYRQYTLKCTSYIYCWDYRYAEFELSEDKDSIKCFKFSLSYTLNSEGQYIPCEEGRKYYLLDNKNNSISFIVKYINYYLMKINVYLNKYLNKKKK